MREVAGVAWDRLKVIAGVVGDAQARAIAMLFYFTILVPFGIGSRLLSDPLRLRMDHTQGEWLNREPVSTELEAAKQQG